jgi:hypothetical protein
MNRTPRRTIHYTQLQDPAPDAVFAEEWRTWRREMPNLLATGFEGKYIVIKGNVILGPFEDLGAALAAGHQHYALERFQVRQVFEYEPILYTPYAG